MLQFITYASDRYTIAEEAQMAIEGGCRWIQVSKSLPEGLTQKEAVEGLMQLCQENDTFLVIDSDVALANEMRVHGVHLGKSDMKPAEAREMLGPHAVIGVDVDSAADILSLRGLDMDYAVIEYGPQHSMENIRDIINQVHDDGFEIHIVVRGDLDLQAITDLRQAGVSGIAMSKTIMEAVDPVSKTSEILSALDR